MDDYPASDAEDPAATLRQQVTAWPGLRLGRGHGGALTFSFGPAELGHLHQSGTVDVVLPRTLRDLLVDRGEAAPHLLAPGTGWVTCRVVDAEGAARARRLLRFSYLYRALALRRRAPSRYAALGINVEDELSELGADAAVRAVYE